MTKRVYLKPDGVTPAMVLTCRMSRGRMHRQRLVDWRALAGLIEVTPRNTAYALGVMRPGLPVSDHENARSVTRKVRWGLRRGRRKRLYIGRRRAPFCSTTAQGAAPDIRARMQECGSYRGARDGVRRFRGGRLYPPPIDA